jgi:tetratricopeptide (TPR) repeat protein
MSPQQLQGYQPNPADDIYALGVVMYELLTGHPPFYPDITPAQIHQEIPPPPNSKLHGDSRIPDRFDSLVARMLAKIPEGRPDSMREVFNVLQQLSNGIGDKTTPPSGIVQTPMEEPSTTSKTEIIIPLEVAVTEEKSVGHTIKRRNRLKLASLGFGLIIILGGGLWLLNYLARNPIGTVSVSTEIVVPEPEVEVLSEKIPPAELSEVIPKEQLQRQKIDAEEQLALFLQVKKELDTKGAEEWGGELYERMAELSNAADAFLIDEEYAAAAEKYSQATVVAKDMRDQTDDVLRRLLQEGELSLKEGEGSRSQHLFSVALMINPENEFAQRSLARAKNIEAVMQLITAGENHEKNNNLEFALADYQEALRLDPESEKAQAAFERVSKLIAAEQFQELMSMGFTALYNNDYERARSLFLKARSFNPDSREVGDALAQVDAAIRLARIEVLRKKAIAAENAENWEEALTSYEAVLRIDIAIQFAEQGKQRVAKYLRIEKRMKYYLEKPTVLESDSYLEKAIQLVTEVENMDPKGLRLANNLKRLKDLVRLAQTPVQVIIESDSLTEIIIYKVGDLGRFSTRELNLRPGTYTVVGARDGFKDVRQKFMVKAGQGPLRVIVKCSEKI